MKVDNNELKPVSHTANEVNLGPFELKKGNYEFTFGVTVSSGAEKKSQASIEMLRFVQSVKR